MRSAAAVGIALLAGCPSVDLGDTPEDIGQCNPAQGEAYFDAMVWPTYLNGSGSAQCTRGGCHDQNGVSGMRFRTDPIDLATNYKIALLKVDCDSPVDSDLLENPLGMEGHGGGQIFASTADPVVQVFLAWFQAP